jgi:transposase
MSVKPGQAHERALRFYEERRRDHLKESAIESRRRVGELLDINPGTLRGWIERAEIDAGTRPGVSSEESAELVRLRKENAELRRANEILKTASAFMPMARLCRKRSAGRVLGPGQTWWGGVAVSA